MPKHELVLRFDTEVSCTRNNSKTYTSKDRYHSIRDTKDRTNKVFACLLAHASGQSAPLITEILNRKAKFNYNTADITHCLNKLRSVGLVGVVGSGRNAVWRLTRNAAELWRKTKKVMI